MILSVALLVHHNSFTSTDSVVGLNDNLQHPRKFYQVVRFD